MSVVIVGGGPAGLGAAYALTRQSDRRILLLERAPALGGLAAGFRHGDYTLDFGPHRLHPATDLRVLRDLRQLLGGDLLLKPRAGLIRLAGRYLPYPIGPRTLARLGPARVVELGAGLLRGRLFRPDDKKDTYEAALVAQLGKPLYELFYGPYAEKVWGMPGSQIAADQAQKRVNQRGLADVVRLALGWGSGRFYYYPRGGFGRIPAAYARALQATRGAELACSAGVEAVEWHNGRTTAVRYAHAAAQGRVEVDHLVWSAPLPELVRRLDPPPPREVLDATAHLRSRAVVLCYVALGIPRVGHADTYYFPERRFPFNRVIEQKSFSPEMVPGAVTVLGMDIACEPDDAVFTASDEQLLELVLPALEEAGLARREQVIEVFSRRFRQAYPVYDLRYRAALDQAQGWLRQIENLWLIGRQGLFLHNNTHHSLLMGYRAADAIAADDRQGWSAALAEFETFRVAD